MCERLVSNSAMYNDDQSVERKAAVVDRDDRGWTTSLGGCS